jgi:hypothetical protein
MPAIAPHARRVVALFGTGALAIGRFLLEAIADRAIETRWPFVPLVFAGLMGIGAAAFAVFVTVSPLAHKSAAPMMRWGAAAAMLFSLAFLASNKGTIPNGYVAGGALLAACLCARRAERLARVRAVEWLADV